MPGILDIFNQNIFGLVSLTDAIQKLPYQPTLIGDMGIFQAQGVAVNTVTFEEKAGVLHLIPTAARGTAGKMAARNLRTARAFNIPHIPYEDAVLAAEVQGVRAFGSENTLDGVVAQINEKMAIMKQNHVVTLEHLQLGALKGIVLDADGTVLYNLFTVYGITPTVVEFHLDQSSTVIRTKCMEVVRAIEDELGGTPSRGVQAFVGREFWDKLIDHDDVRKTYINWEAAASLREDFRQQGFQWAGINWREYRGTVDSVKFVADDECRFFPMGVPGLFKTYFGPADFVETVNTIGQPLYAKQERMPFDRGITIHTQQNPLPICHRPGVLIEGKMTAASSSSSSSSSSD